MSKVIEFASAEALRSQAAKVNFPANIKPIITAGAVITVLSTSVVPVNPKIPDSLHGDQQFVAKLTNIGDGKVVRNKITLSAAKCAEVFPQCISEVNGKFVVAIDGLVFVKESEGYDFNLMAQPNGQQSASNPFGG